MEMMYVWILWNLGWWQNRFFSFSLFEPSARLQIMSSLHIEVCIPSVDIQRTQQWTFKGHWIHMHPHYSSHMPSTLTEVPFQHLFLWTAIKSSGSGSKHKGSGIYIRWMTNEKQLSATRYQTYMPTSASQGKHNEIIFRWTLIRHSLH